MVKAVTVPSSMLKKILTIRMMPVFLKPMSRYLLLSTSAKFCSMVRSSGGSSNGEVVTISPLLFSKTNRVSRMGVTTITTMLMHRICLKIWVSSADEFHTAGIILATTTVSGFSSAFRYQLSCRKVLCGRTMSSFI